jgi:putative transposase
MIKQRFTQNDRITIGNVAYKFVSQDRELVSLAREDGVGGPEPFSYDSIAGFQKSSQWRFERDFYDSQRTKLSTSMPALTLDHLSAKHRQKTIWYFVICMVLKQLYDAGDISLTDYSIATNLPLLQIKMNEIEEKRHNLGVDLRGFADMKVRKLPCTKTIRTKFARLRQFGYNLLSLAPDWYRTPKSTSKFDDETEAAILCLIREIATREMTNKSEIARQTIIRLGELNFERADIGLALLGVPSQRTIERRIEGMNKAELYAIFHGVTAARKEFAISAGGLSKQVLMERIEFDECELDIFTYFNDLGIYEHLPKTVRDKIPHGRRWFCCAIDTRSRAILGIRVAKTASSEEAIKLLRMVVRDKTDIAKAMGCESLWPFFGGLGIVACDTGSAFACDEFIAAVTALGGTIFFPPVKVPELRGEIERVFGTINSKVMPRVYGRAFHKPAARGDYDSEGRAILDDNDLARILTIFFVDFYHNHQHTGLDFQSPANCWRELEDKYFVNAPPDRHTIRSAVGIEMRRKLSKRGILVFGNYYSCEELREHWSESSLRMMRIKIDPHDIGEISILIGKIWVTADAFDCNLDGVHLTSWVTEFRAIRTRNKAESELSYDLRDRALKNIDAICKSAALRAGIGPHDLTKEQVIKLQKDLFHDAKFSQRPDLKAGAEKIDMLGTRFETGTAFEDPHRSSEPDDNECTQPDETTETEDYPTLKLED